MQPTALGRSAEERITDKFLAIAEASPRSTAICHGASYWTYGQLARVSGQLALYVEERAGSRSGVVALHASRCPYLVAAMLACLRAGLTFAVLDSAYPKARLVKMARVMRPALVLGVGVSPAELIAVFGEDPETTLATVDDACIDCIKDGPLRVAGAPSRQVSADALAYLLFTSGTTGTPKCVATNHRPLVHFIDWYVRTFSVTRGHQFSLLSGLGHDPILRDIFVPLSTGGTVCIPEQELITDPPRLFDWIQSTEIEYLHATPQLLWVIRGGAGATGTLPRLRYVMSGGDTLRRNHVAAIGEIAPNCQVVNFYGATETPQAMAFHVVDRDSIPVEVPIGRGIDGVQLLVLRDDLSRCAVHEEGQIAIRTRYLSCGYLNASSTVPRRFVVPPSQLSDGERLYLTGDYGAAGPNGEVVVKGRLDDQVKIRGFRVELGEVISALEEDPRVQSATVLAQSTPNGENRLVAYLVPADQSRAQDAAVLDGFRTMLGGKLPSYMVPSQFFWLDAIPLLPNGKVDRTGLPDFAAAPDSVAGATEVLERDVLGRLVAEWGRILAVSRLDVGKSFVDLGGDSLSHIQASMKVESILGWLPPGWEKLPLSVLAAEQVRARSTFSVLSMPVLVRALSIVLIVVGHVTSWNVLGSTTALFIVSGWSLGSYQLDSVVKTGSVRSILATVLKIAAPTIPYCLFLQLRYDTTIHWTSLAMVSNYTEPFYTLGSFWFLNLLVQNLLIIAALLSIPAVRKFVAKDAFGFAVTATAVTLAASLLGPRIWNTASLGHNVPHMKIWLMFLGICVARADRPWKRGLVTLLLLPVAVSEVPGGENGTYWFPLISALVLVHLPRVVVPRSMARIIGLVAGGSLFIYLTEWQSLGIVKKTPLIASSVVTTLVVVLMGVVLWRLWERTTAEAVAWAHRSESVWLRRLLSAGRRDAAVVPETE